MEQWTWAGFVLPSPSCIISPEVAVTKGFVLVGRICNADAWKGHSADHRVPER